jgi:anti-sigma B factor antagonist
MKFKTSQHGPVTVIGIEGNLMGGPDAAALHTKLHELIGKGRKLVVLDMHGVRVVNSSGLGLMIGGITTMKNAGGRLVFTGMSEKIWSLIVIAKLTSVFEHHDSVNAAVKNLKK